MSTDDIGERTQRPTERRRREARARGEVARSADLVTALVFLSAAAALWWLGPSLGMELAGMMRSGLSTAPPAALDQGAVAAQLVHAATRLAVVALPILLVIVLAAVVANLLQTGFLWVPTAVLPRFERIDPSRGFARWWTMPSWVGLAGSVIKLVVLPAALLIHVRTRLASAGPLVEGSPLAQLSLAARLMGELAVVLSLSLVALAILDYGYQFWRQERRLMMTIEEIRRELRESEGDPQLKRRRREMTAAGASKASGASGGTTSETGSADGIRPV